MNPTETVIVLVDIQGKLAEVMHEHELLSSNLVRLVRGAQPLQIPILWLEQIPEKMGPTIAPLRELLTGQTPIAKTSFSGAGEPRFMQALAATGRRHVLLAGIETHVCIYQTAMDLKAAGYTVDILADCVSSRRAADRQLALQRLAASGILPASLEMALFDMMKSAEHPAFREVLKAVK